MFVGPPGDVQRKLGEKTQARRLAREAGVPVAEGTVEPLRDIDHARREAERIGYPVMLKAAAGGGGKWMRAVASVGELDAAWRLASGEAAGAFGSAALFVEKLIENARHVEMQILADAHGGIVWLGERDCSIQRRHQKLIEESPAPSVDDALRERLGDAAVRIARAAGYQNAGTAEFLVDARGGFSFLEVNTRLQVEHPVTELVTGLDLVALQLRIAAGEKLSIDQDEVEWRGHAIECRINAEAAHKKFAPAPGTIGSYREPAGPGVRVDSGVEAGSEVTPMYDPMVAKLIVWDADRELATRRMLRALGEYEIGGITTLIPFHSTILATEQWAKGETCRDLLEDPEWIKSLAPEAAPTPAEKEDEELEPRDYKVEVGGKLFDVRVFGAPITAATGGAAGLRKPPKRERKASGGGGGATEELVSPLQGTVLKVAVEQGAEVEEGALICVVEAMKMENEITAHRAGKVEALNVSEGASLASGDVIAVIK